MKTELSRKDGKRAEKPADIEIRTFGFFTVFVDGRAMLFRRSWSKAILAYLVDRRGQSVVREVLADEVLNEERYDTKIQNKLNVYIDEMKRQLKEAGIENILICQKGEYALDTTAFRCDLYDYLNDYNFPVREDPGTYLQEYEWARERRAFLHRVFWKEF